MDYLRSLDPSRIGEVTRTAGEGRTTTEELSIECYTKTAREGYENIVDAGSTFCVYCWGNMLGCGESGCGDVDDISRSIKMSGVSNR